MGLIGNFARQNYGAVRFNGGGALALTRGNLARARPGLWRNAMHRDGQTEAIDLMAMPDGAYPRLAWRLPITAGRISGIGGAAVTVDASATLEKGVPISGTAGIEIAASGTGGLIVSVAGTIALVIDANGTLFASKQVAGSAGIDIDAAGAIWGTGEFSATAGVEIGASATLIGIGTIAGSTEESGLTVPGIVNAVWGAVASEFNEAGTMGNKLNTASSGGVDLDALAAAVWSYLNRTLTSGATPSAEDVAAAVLAAAQVDPIHANMVETVGTELHGDGTEGDKFRSALVP